MAGAIVLFLEGPFMKMAYFDCFAGAGGDMIVAAMLDAGLDSGFLNSQLATLGLKGLDIRVGETSRAGLRAIRFEPAAPKQHHNRNLKQITHIIGESRIDEKAKKTATEVFARLAAAEAVVHGKDPHDVHFHEVGAVDSIVDIVSAAVGLEALGIQKVYCSSLSVGAGTVKCEHGLLPVPAPAAAELLKNVPISGGPIQNELLTPTAAAILTTIAEDFGPLPAMVIETIGYGAGTADPKGFPNVLRLVLGRSAGEQLADADTICLLETNVDDVSAELLGFVAEELLRQGALDVFTTPVIMKQNRPGVRVSILCKTEDAARLEQLVFEQGVTLGIRRRFVQRSKLAREIVTVTTEFGQIRVKKGLMAGRAVSVKPEFSDCVSAAQKYDVAVKTVVQAAMAAYDKTAANTL
jgi:uncharacterized protein (TIGR00299 family) protein